VAEHLVGLGTDHGTQAAAGGFVEPHTRRDQPAGGPTCRLSANSASAVHSVIPIIRSPAV